MTRCVKCPKPAIIYQRYSGMHLCRTHFAGDVQRKTRESLRRTGLFAGSLRLALIMDGGMGSSVMAYILRDLFARRRDIELIAIIIDDQAVEVKKARDLAERLGIRAVMLDMPAVHKLRGTKLDSSPGPGSSGLNMGGIKKADLKKTDPKKADLKMDKAYCLAQEMRVDVLATGRDLDDEAIDIFVSYLEGDIAALRAIKKEQNNIRRQNEPEMIPCIRPLQRIPKKEVRLYALCHDLPFYDQKYDDDQKDDDNQEDRDILYKEARRQLDRFDSRHPGTMYSLLRSIDKLALD